ncbi:hypothetical protein ACQKOF_13570 [Lysinibacillus sp. NPDC093190]|uniref:hypothetical protein n=1 Tax=Lysinibacillus sp. NPDC093190 TaxID=3390575 RepID=UPI003D07AFC2
MIESIEEARQQKVKVDNNSYVGAKTAIYGIEATLPKNASNLVFIEVPQSA